MKVFLDTNVLVAASIRQHPFFGRADTVIQRCAKGEDAGIINAHSLLEFHSAVTQLPRGLAIPPALVDPLLTEGIIPFVRCVMLTARQVRKLQIRAGRLGLIGGIIYDFYHLAVAERGKVDRLYTFNPAHFRKLAPGKFADRIVAP